MGHTNFFLFRVGHTVSVGHTKFIICNMTSLRSPGVAGGGRGWPGVDLPYLPDEPYARDLQAQGACALRFFLFDISPPLPRDWLN